MATRTSWRRATAVDYNEKQAGGSVPAWTRQLEGSGSGGKHKENSKPAKQQPRKSAPAAVAVKGRDAGLTRLPIEDAKAGSKPGSGKTRSELVPAAAGKQVLPGVVVKAGAAAATAKAGPSSKGNPAAHLAAAAQAKPSGSGGSKQSGDKPGPNINKRKPSAMEAGVGKPTFKPASKSAPAAATATAAFPAPDAKRHKAALAPAQPQSQQAGQEWAEGAAMARLVGAAAAAEQVVDVELPGSGADELVEHYAANFTELQAEYHKLQALYEDLKAAKIDEEVAMLLEQQNKHVTEHGHKAAQLAEHYKAEAELHAAAAAELGGGAVVDQCHRLQADLMNCQQALLDKEAESVEQGKVMAEMQARLSFLERFARTYDSCDKCIQTDPPPLANASAQYPSIQSSGVEMLQAHALVPEGAGGGSIYKRPKAGMQPADDPSYTLHGLTPAQAAGVARDAAGGDNGRPVAATADAAAGEGLPATGSDMQLTDGDETQPQLPHAAPQLQPGAPSLPAPSPAQQQQQQQQQAAAVQQRRQSLQPMPHQQPQQQQQQQQRRQSLQPVSGRLAHVAAAPSSRPPSAESQVQPLALGAAGGGGRRVSAQAAPTDRQLRFSASEVSQEEAPQLPQPLAAVPEEDQPAAPHNKQLQHHNQAFAAAATPGAHTPGAPTHAPMQALMPAPMPGLSPATAAAALAVAGAAAPTPGSVPPPPRHLALPMLTGLTFTPLKGGSYQFTDPRHGFVFLLGAATAEPDSAPLPGDASDAEICYRPVSLGSAARLLPSYLRGEITFRESQRGNFVSQLLDALAQQQ